MAREFAPIRCSIWDDEDFQHLSRSAQCTYIQLCSQRKLSMAGVVSYTPRAWSRGCDDMKIDDLERDVDELIAARFVLVDDVTEELLLRTLVKHDPPRGPKSITALWRAWEAIDSPELRLAVIRAVPDEVWNWEVNGVPIEHPADVLAIRDAPSDAPSGPGGGTRTHLRQPSASCEPSPQVNAPSDGGSYAPSTDLEDSAESVGVEHHVDAPSDAPSDGACAHARAASFLLPPSTGHSPPATLPGVDLDDAPSTVTPIRRRNVIFDALVEACGWDYGEMTKAARGACGTASAQLEAVMGKPSPRATPDELDTWRQEILRRAQIYPLVMPPNTTLTPTALAKHWPACAHPPEHKPTLTRSNQAVANAIAKHIGGTA